MIEHDPAYEAAKRHAELEDCWDCGSPISDLCDYHRGYANGYDAAMGVMES